MTQKQFLKVWRKYRKLAILYAADELRVPPKEQYRNTLLTSVNSFSLVELDNLLDDLGENEFGDILQQANSLKRIIRELF